LTFEAGGDCIDNMQNTLIQLCTLLLVVVVLVVLEVSNAAFVALPPASSLIFPHNNPRCGSRIQQAQTLESIQQSLQESLDASKDMVVKKSKVKVGFSSIDGRLGLVATESIRAGDVLLAVPYDDLFCLTPKLARNVVWKNRIPDKYDGWTGDMGLIALLILNEVARVGGKGISLPQRKPNIQAFMSAWVSSLPSPKEMTKNHPLMWSEKDQEVLQSSSTRKIYQALDDLEEDAAWLTDNVWSKDRTTFPETVTWNGETIPCFHAQGYKWAAVLANSRAYFLDGTLRLMPFMDLANHQDEAKEIEGDAFMGRFNTIKGAQIVADRAYNAGEEVFVSYGPKSAADFLLEHGFCPPGAWESSVSMLQFEVDPNDPFYDDKMGILEFDTGEGPMDPTQSFDVVSKPGGDPEPDPSMIQFVRLCKLGGKDAFLLESVFRQEVWHFMSMPVSETNELEVVTAVIDACKKALEEMEQCPQGGPEVCTKLRESENWALTRTMEYLQREKEALNLKEYYQERRLKDLGLDKEWDSAVDDLDDDDMVGQGRVPGGADYNW